MNCYFLFALALGWVEFPWWHKYPSDHASGALTPVVCSSLDVISDHITQDEFQCQAGTPSNSPSPLCAFRSSRWWPPHDKRDVLWRQHEVIRQRQRPPADLHPRHQGQHSGPPEAALLPAAEPPGPGELAHAARPGPAHHPGSAGSVSQAPPPPPQSSPPDTGHHTTGEMGSSKQKESTCVYLEICIF